MDETKTFEFKFANKGTTVPWPACLQFQQKKVEYKADGSLMN